MVLLLALLQLSDATAEQASSPVLVHEATSAFFESVYVVDEAGLRSLRFGSLDGDEQSLIDPAHPERLPMPYLRAAAVGLVVPERVERLLMIGLGGGAFARFVHARDPAVVIDAVEIDPVVAEIARDYFGVREHSGLTVHIQDGVDFVRRDKRVYDYILLDAYDGEGIPAPLVSTPFFDDVSARLAPGGVVVANVAVAGRQPRKTLIRRLSIHFGHCLKLRTPPEFNDVLLLSASPLPSISAIADALRLADGDDALGLQPIIASATACREY